MSNATNLPGSDDIEAAPALFAPPETNPSPGRGRLVIWLGRLGLLVAVIAIWAAISGTLVKEAYISNPADVANQLWTWLRDGTITDNIWVTLQEVVLGFVIGAFLGTVAGLAIGMVKVIGDIVQPAIQAAYSVPNIALLPLFIVWFGIGLTPKIVLAAVATFFVVFFTTFSGAREVDEDFIDVLRVMGAKRLAILRKVVIPSTFTWIFTGLTISVPHAFTAAVAGEILVSDRGIGYLVQSSANNFNTAGVFAGIIVILVVAIIMGVLLRLTERRVQRWKTL